MTCMCGALDCPQCYPFTGRRIGRRWYYNDPDDDTDLDRLQMEYEERELDDYEARKLEAR